MRTLARITVVLLIAFTAWATQVDPTPYALSVGPINVNIFDVLFLMVAVLLVRELTLEHGQGIPSANRTVVALALGYFAYQLAVVLPAAVMFHDLEPIAVVRQLENRCAIILIPFMYLVAVRSMSPRRLVALVNVSAVCMALLAMYAYATVGPSAMQSTQAVERVRETGGASALLFGFLILTSLFLQRPNFLAYAMAVVGVISIALANHRSAFLALIVVAPPLFINSRRVARRAIVIAVVAASAALLLFTVAPVTRESLYYSLRTMVNPNADSNTQARVDRSRLGWDYFVAHPLGDYQWSQRYYLVYVGPDTFEPHNFVIQLLSQQGIVGFAFIAGIIVATARIAWHNRRADRMSAVMLAYFTFYLLFNLFNTIVMHVNNIFLLALPVGVILAQNAALAASSEEVRSPVAGLEPERLLTSHDAAR